MRSYALMIAGIIEAVIVIDGKSHCSSKRGRLDCAINRNVDGDIVVDTSKLPVGCTFILKDITHVD